MTCPRYHLILSRAHFSYCPLITHCCTALHCTALHCTALHCTAPHSLKTTQQRNEMHCIVLYCTAPHSLKRSVVLSNQIVINKTALPAPSCVQHGHPLIHQIAGGREGHTTFDTQHSKYSALHNEHCTLQCTLRYHYTQHIAYCTLHSAH